MSNDIEMTMNLFRQFMFKNVYLAPALIPDRNKASHVVKTYLLILWNTLMIWRAVKVQESFILPVMWWIM